MSETAITLEQVEQAKRPKDASLDGVSGTIIVKLETGQKPVFQFEGSITGYYVSLTAKHLKRAYKEWLSTVRKELENDK